MRGDRLSRAGCRAPPHVRLGSACAAACAPPHSWLPPPFIGSGCCSSVTDLFTAWHPIAKRPSDPVLVAQPSGGSWLAGRLPATPLCRRCHAASCAFIRCCIFADRSRIARRWRSYRRVAPCNLTAARSCSSRARTWFCSERMTWLAFARFRCMAFFRMRSRSASRFARHRSTRATSAACLAASSSAVSSASSRIARSRAARSRARRAAVSCLICSCRAPISCLRASLYTPESCESEGTSPAMEADREGSGDGMPDVAGLTGKLEKSRGGTAEGVVSGALAAAAAVAAATRRALRARIATHSGDGGREAFVPSRQQCGLHCEWGCAKLGVACCESSECGWVCGGCAARSGDRGRRPRLIPAAPGRAGTGPVGVTQMPVAVRRKICASMGSLGGNGAARERISVTNCRRCCRSCSADACCADFGGLEEKETVRRHVGEGLREETCSAGGARGGGDDRRWVRSPSVDAELPIEARRAPAGNGPESTCCDTRTGRKQTVLYHWTTDSIYSYNLKELERNPTSYSYH